MDSVVDIGDLQFELAVTDDEQLLRIDDLLTA